MPTHVTENHSDNQKEQKVHSAEAPGIRLNVTLSKTKQRDKSELLQRMHLDNYDLLQGQTFDERMKALTPHGTPEYIDRGEKYVERIMRSLYHFKQCALIGPSGTGKTHIVYLVAESPVSLYGRSTAVFRLPHTISLEGM